MNLQQKVISLGVAQCYRGEEVKDKVKNEIVLIRGLPGSGKTTAAKNMNAYEHFEADMFLMVDCKYVYDPSKINAAHDWCVAKAKESLEKGLNVVVSNTFVKLWEMDRYIKLGYPYRIVEMKNRWKNVHGVPEDKVEEMARRWEALGVKSNGYP